MILSCHSFTDSRLHQSREWGQHVDRWIHLTIMQLPDVEQKKLQKHFLQTRLIYKTLGGKWKNKIPCDKGIWILGSKRSLFWMTKVPVDVNLSLCNVTSQIGNWVSDVVVGHSEDGDLGDGPSSALNPTGPLVDGSQIRVHVTGETTPSGNLRISVAGQSSMCFYFIVSR